MSFREVSNSGLLYVTVIIAILLIVVAILYYLKVCYQHALKCGVDKSVMRKVVKSSISFAIIPSLAVVVGLVSLVAVIGIPYSWLRLSVIGSVAYELMASQMALSAINVDVATANGYAFGLVMWAMCTGVTLSLVVNIFLVKKIHMGTLKLGEKDPRWSPVAQSVFITTLLAALIVPIFGKGIAFFLTYLTSMAIALLIALISSKTNAKWLGDFTLAFSLVGAMVLSVFFDSWFA